MAIPTMFAKIPYTGNPDVDFYIKASFIPKENSTITIRCYDITKAYSKESYITTVIPIADIPLKEYGGALYYVTRTQQSFYCGTRPITYTFNSGGDEPETAVIDTTIKEIANTTINDAATSEYEKDYLIFLLYSCSAVQRNRNWHMDELPDSNLVVPFDKYDDQIADCTATVAEPTPGLCAGATITTDATTASSLKNYSPKMSIGWYAYFAVGTEDTFSCSTNDPNVAIRRIDRSGSYLIARIEIKNWQAFCRNININITLNGVDGHYFSSPLCYASGVIHAGYDDPYNVTLAAARFVGVAGILLPYIARVKEIRAQDGQRFLLKDEESTEKIVSLEEETRNSIAGLYVSKQDRLVFDEVPTENSNKMLTSGSVYTALSNKTVLCLLWSYDKATDKKEITIPTRLADWDELVFVPEVTVEYGNNAYVPAGLESRVLITGQQFDMIAVTVLGEKIFYMIEEEGDMTTLTPINEVENTTISQIFGVKY